MIGRLAVAVSAAAILVVGAPFVGQIRGAIRSAFPEYYRLIIGGLIAIFDDSWREGALGQYAEATANTWGWTALILGVLVLFAAFGILKGATWARVVAVILTALQAIAHFGTVRGYPVWSFIVIVLCVFVIYALTVHGKELKVREA